MTDKTKNIVFWSTIAAIYAIFAYIFYCVDGRITFQGLLAAVLLTSIGVLIILCFKTIVWRVQNGVDVFATLETNPENVKEHMLFVMQYGNGGGIVGVIKEFNKIFRNYPQWDLQHWEVFQAWYKYEIDLMSSEPEIYHMTLFGEPYRKENDPLYNPDAPDWALFDRDHSHDLDPTRDYEDYSGGGNKKRKAAENGFFRNCLHGRNTVLRNSASRSSL